MTRPVRVIIDHTALHHNLHRVRELAPHSKTIAVVKANAYGHGLQCIAISLQNKVDAFAVASFDEAQQLREIGIIEKILLLEGAFDEHELRMSQKLNLDIVVHDEAQLATLENVTLNAPVSVWLKIDTGMHRLGFKPECVQEVKQRLIECKNISSELRFMTHFACAEEVSNPMTSDQIALFNQCCTESDGERSMANSGGILAWKESHVEWVRPGIMLYGISPMEDTSDNGLKPVMGFYSELIAVKSLKKGDPVGYGARWQCPEDMSVGIIAAGYGDGYPRHIAAETPLLVNGQRTVILSSPTMDMILVDLRHIKDVEIGSTVELWGPNLSVNEIAKQANTISYELLCGIQQRVKTIDNGQG